MAAILEFFPDAAAHPNAVVRSHGNVAKVEEIMQVGAQQETISNLMRASLRVGTNVSGFESGQCFLARNRTATRIGIGYLYSKRPLP